MEPEASWDITLESNSIVGARIDDTVPPLRGTPSFQWWLKSHKILIKEIEWGLDNIVKERMGKEIIDSIIKSLKKRGVAI